MKISRLLCILLSALFIFNIPFSAYAQYGTAPRVRISSSPSPLGSGARALGMGSAFIAIADDATAASWNPGGLMQLETPEASIVIGFPTRTDNFSSSTHSETSASFTGHDVNINYLSAAYPFNLFEQNMIISLSYQRLFDMNQTIDVNYQLTNTLSQVSLPTTTNITTDYLTNVDYKSSGGVKVFAPAFAIQLTDDLSIGATLNIWRDMFGGLNGWNNSERLDGTGTVTGTVTFPGNVLAINESFNFTYDLEEKFTNFRGYNFNFGFLWSMTHIITLGGVFKSPLAAKMDHYKSEQTTSQVAGGPISTSTPTPVSDTVELHFPMSYGAGLAFRFSDELTFAIDFYRTEWSDYFFKAGDGTETSPIDGRPRSASVIEATTQFHAGVEYLFILEKTIIPLRGGLFLEPEPTEGSPKNFYGVSVGTGASIGDLILDITYRFRWGNDTGGDSTDIENMVSDVRQHTVYTSLIYHF